MKLNRLHNTIHNTEALRRMILENPDLPLLVFAGEEANGGDYGWMCCTDVRVEKGEVLDCAGPKNEYIYTDRVHHLACNQLKERKPNMILDFYIPGEPERTTAQEGHRMSRGHYYTDPKIKAVRQGLIEELKPNAPKEPIAGPVHLRIDFFFGTADVKKQGCWKVTRPDTDNLIKLMKDCMTEAGFWKDDSQVCMEMVSKTWVPEDEACTRIQLYQMQTH